MARLGLGTVQFGTPYGVAGHGQVPLDTVRQILSRAQSGGIDLLDTAANYGEAEAVLAQCDTTAFRIVTKTTNLNKGLDVLIARVRESARLLPHADTLMVHMADDLHGPDGDKFWNTLEALRGEGLYRKLGISAYAEQEPALLAARFRPDIVQTPFSLLDQRHLQNGTLARLKDLGVEIHARSLFLQGLLFMETLPEKLRHAESHLTATRSRIRAAGATPLSAALDFVLSRPEIDVALVGVNTVTELDEILQAAKNPQPGLDHAACAIDDALVLTPWRW